jgi:hypothetical protein
MGARDGHWWRVTREIDRKKMTTTTCASDQIQEHDFPIIFRQRTNVSTNEYAGGVQVQRKFKHLAQQQLLKK